MEKVKAPEDDVKPENVFCASFPSVFESYIISIQSERYGFILLFISKQYSNLLHKFIRFLYVWKLFCIIYFHNFYRWQLILVLACRKYILRIPITGNDKYAVVQLTKTK